MAPLSREIKESDWKYLSKLAPTLLERAFEQINKESVSIMKNQKKLSQKDLYWELSDHMKKKIKIVVKCFDDHRRSTAKQKICNIRHHKFFTDEEYKGFSEETRAAVE